MEGNCYASALIALSAKNSVQDTLNRKLSDKSDLILTEGWIEEVWHKATGEDLFKSQLNIEVGSVNRYWHTWFTGLYRLDSYDTGLWCPGGPLAQCIEKLELKRRPETSQTLGVSPHPN